MNFEPPQQTRRDTAGQNQQQQRQSVSPSQNFFLL